MERAPAPRASQALATQTRATALGLCHRGSRLKTYFDTSALVKVFTLEAGHEVAADLLETSSTVATSRLTYVECVSAFWRAAHERRATSQAVGEAIASLERQWVHLVVVELNDGVMRHAGELVRAHRLRAADAVHLASALRFDAPIRFACWDRKLATVAATLGLIPAPPV